MFVRRSVTLASLTAALASSLVLGCASDGASIHVVCSVQPTVSSDSCTYDPKGDMCVLEGIMNLAAANRYLVALQVQSGLKPRASDVPPRSEVNGIQLTSAEVELRTTAGSAIGFNGLPNPFEIQSSGYVPPRDKGLVTLTLIPPAYASQLRTKEKSTSPLGQIVVAVKVKGRTDGQVDVETDEWLWPVRLTYQSPVMEDNLCTPFTMGVCANSVGIDDFANACGCSDKGDGKPTCRL